MALRGVFHVLRRLGTSPSHCVCQRQRQRQSERATLESPSTLKASMLPNHIQHRNLDDIVQEPPP